MVSSLLLGSLFVYRSRHELRLMITTVIPGKRLMIQRSNSSKFSAQTLLSFTI